LLGNSLQRFPMRLAQHADTLPPAQLQRRLRRSIIYQSQPARNHLLHPRPAHGVKSRRQKLVQSLARILGRNGNKNRKLLWHSCEEYYSRVEPARAATLLILAREQPRPSRP